MFEGILGYNIEAAAEYIRLGARVASAASTTSEALFVASEAERARDPNSFMRGAEARRAAQNYLGELRAYEEGVPERLKAKANIDTLIDPRLRERCEEFLDRE